MRLLPHFLVEAHHMRLSFLDHSYSVLKLFIGLATAALMA